jgi:hypothetical protein
VKQWLNPLIERAGMAVFGVDQYADIFEKLAMARTNRPLLRTAFRRRIAPDIAASPLLFIHVPKNGGTSIKRALYTSDPGHCSVRYYDLFFPGHMRRSETLAIIREPADRFLSAFDFLMNGGGRDVSIQPRPLARMAGVRTLDDFLDFLEGLNGDWLKADTFVRPQSWYISDIRGIIQIRHLLLLDQATDGLQAFLKSRNIASLPHVNRTERTQRELTTQQAGRLARLYPMDFRLYAELKRMGGSASTAS